MTLSAGAKHLMDKQTFVEKKKKKSRALYRVARAILRNEDDCNDALQESVMKAWASRHKLRDECYFATWMTRIVINECRTIQRKQSKFHLEADVAMGAVRFDDPMLYLDLHRAMDNLPEKLRLPLVLHYIEGYSLKEISTMLHLPVTTIRNRLYAARQDLRLDLEDEREAQAYEA
jgi:RNA polymerase sigma-70 factor (ECF subfamily)